MAPLELCPISFPQIGNAEIISISSNFLKTMALTQNIRNILSRISSSSYSSIRQSQIAFNRLQSTLTTPKLFIGGLSRATTNEKLKEVFGTFGQLVEAKIIVDRPTGRSKGFAFVTYSSIEEAEKAREGMNTKFIDGWVIFVDPATSRKPRPGYQPQSQTRENGFSVNKTVGWCG